MNLFSRPFRLVGRAGGKPMIGCPDPGGVYLEVVMTKKVLIVAALGAASVTSLLAGCAQSQPYSLTGKSDEQVAEEHEQWRQQMMYTDEKGHFHPELASQHQRIH